jgi:peptidoglycan/LPS O-acetylase OafA/YrhL
LLQEETRIHLAYLDGWRGLAVTLVLIGHFWLDRHIPGISVLGVDLFFVLSGRLMAEILYIQKAELSTFFVRRFSRIYPGLLCFVLVSTLAFWPTELGHGLMAVAAALTFTINYAMVYAHPVALMDHLWSLCVEEHGYMLLALVALLARRGWCTPFRVMLVIGGAALANGIIQRDVFDRDFFSVFWRTDVSVAAIFLSGGIHLLVQRHGLGRISPWIAPLALGAGVLAKLWGPNAVVSFGLGTVLLALSVTTVGATFSALRHLLETRLLGWLGLLSYSLYLWQQPFYKLSESYAPMTPFLLLGAMLAGIASFYLVERPSRSFLNRLWASAKPRFVSPPSPSRAA